MFLRGGGNKDRAGAAGRESRIELLVKRAKSKLGANLGMKRRAKVGAAGEQGLLEHRGKANLRYLQSRGWCSWGWECNSHTYLKRAA